METCSGDENDFARNRFFEQVRRFVATGELGPNEHATRWLVERNRIPYQLFQPVAQGTAFRPVGLADLVEMHLELAAGEVLGSNTLSHQRPINHSCCGSYYVQ